MSDEPQLSPRALALLEMVRKCEEGDPTDLTEEFERMGAAAHGIGEADKNLRQLATLVADIATILAINATAAAPVLFPPDDGMDNPGA